MQTYDHYISPRLQLILNDSLIPSLRNFSDWLYGGQESVQFTLIPVMHRRVGSQPPQLIRATCYM